MGKRVTKPKKKSTLITKLDICFSQFVRLRDYNNEGGFTECYTCGKKKVKIGDVHCGHFISRTKYPTRWDEDNCKTQCIRCNTYGAGQQFLFARKMGYVKAESILQKSISYFTPSEEWLEDKIKYYTEEVAKLKELKPKVVYGKTKGKKSPTGYVWGKKKKK